MNGELGVEVSSDFGPVWKVRTAQPRHLERNFDVFCIFSIKFRKYRWHAIFKLSSLELGT